MKKQHVVKRFALPLLWLLLIVCAAAFRPAPARAAAYQSVPDDTPKKIGSYYFKRGNYTYIYYASSKNGSYKIVDSAQSAFTNGKEIVYIRSVNDEQRLFRYTIKTGKTKLLRRFKDSSKPLTSEPPYYRINTVYGNNVYVSRGSFDEWNYREYRYNLKTGKWAKVLSKGFISDVYGKYVIVDHDYRSDVSPASYSLYQIQSNGSLKKTRALGKYICSASFAGGKVYYGAYPSSGSVKKMSLYRCNANGTGLKKLATFTTPEEYGMVMTYDYSAKKCKVNTGSATYEYTYSTGKKKLLSSW